MCLRKGFMLLGRGIHISEKEWVPSYFKYIIFSSYYSGVQAFAKRFTFLEKGFTFMKK